MKNVLQWGLAFLVVSSLVLYRVFAQGSLTPATAPAPAMRSLDQIYSEVAKLTTTDESYELPQVVLASQQAPIHMSVVGEKQGIFQGPSTVRGYEKSILCSAFSHEVISPRDAASGLPTGQRQHKPVVILKRIDKTTPCFWAALVSNENLPAVTFNFFEVNSKGDVTNYYRVKLTNASIAGIRAYSLSSESISFCYQSVEWIHVSTGGSASDDWETPGV